MGSMRDDINKYSDIWEKALQNNIFPETPKPKKVDINSEDDSDFGSDFFGQNYSDEYDMDAPLNESDIKYWNHIMGKPVSEETTPSRKEVKDGAEKMANTHNPTYYPSRGKDSDYIAPMGGEKLEKLEELKKKLHSLEAELSKMNLDEKKSSTAKSKIENLKKQIDDLSDSLSGNRFSRDG